jgi:predicted RNase H-like nuclease (RuvC/YqgF family)
MSEMQAEENKTLKQHVHSFNEENKSLKNLVGVLETDVSKLDDLESQLDQMKELYAKEKDMNEKLLISAQEADDDSDTGESGDENPGVARVKGGAAD